MASKGQFTGMRGVYLVAAELARRGFIASPTSRSAIGADLLVTDAKMQRAYSVQVKTNAGTFNFWLVGKHATELASDSYIYVLVNLREKPKGGGEDIQYFVVPSNVVKKHVLYEQSKTGTEWYSFMRTNAEPYRDKWSVFDE